MVVKCTGDLEARVARDDGHVHTRLLLVTCATSRREVDAEPKLLICRELVLRGVQGTDRHGVLLHDRVRLCTCRNTLLPWVT